MYKVKTKSAAKKRIKVTASGKLKRKFAFKSHLLACKSTKQKRHLSKKTLISNSDMPRIKKILCL